MARARKDRDEDAVETDRIEGWPHPRATSDLIGQDAALTRAAIAIRAGRPPSAWLLAGPPGIGKATLAYRIARYLLRYGATDAGPENLDVPVSDPVSQLIEAGSHPGLLALTRRPDDKGKVPTVIGVEEIRRVTPFFGMTSGAGGWRVAIVDPADEMNEQAANALLKTLEEPPPRSMLLLVAHAPGRLLPTIRSRCQRIDLKPFAPEVLAAELAKRLPEMDKADRALLADLAQGSLGAALRLAGDEGLDLARAAEGLLNANGPPDVAQILALGERIGRAQDGLLHFGNFLTQILAHRIYARGLEGAPQLQRWVEQWEQAGRIFARARGLHLEPRQTILSTALALSAAKRQYGAP